PRDMNKCKVGQCKYVFVTAEDGGIINDPILLRLEENRFWLSLADSDVMLWAKGVAYNSGLDVTIQEIDVAPVQVQGPKAKQVMVDMFGEKVLEIPYYHLMEAELDGMQVVISRTGYSSEIGYEIYVRNASRFGEALWSRVYEAGRPHGMQVIGPCHIRRIEGGILAFGCDIWYDTNPFEVGMGYDWMVDLRGDDDFIGRAALERIKAVGPKRMLVGLEIDGPSVGYFTDSTMIDCFPVYDAEGSRIGKVTSACRSPRLEKNIGMALVPIAHAEIGNEVLVETQSGWQQAVVVPKPFFDPHKSTPKS
ncbi:MAG: glycine cleavage T C-terminal barrel domain-containing protein, partial [Gammaproteobacteria bacterium]|nr:glycine cleavage T C-terminal barrel domain-containing protein [Gammaproteobacteria bacterium]